MRLIIGTILLLINNALMAWDLTHGGRVLAAMVESEMKTGGQIWRAHLIYVFPTFGAMVIILASRFLDKPRKTRE